MGGPPAATFHLAGRAAQARCCGGCGGRGGLQGSGTRGGPWAAGPFHCVFKHESGPRFGQA
eukprot:6472767-Lingulodinium_polyedra.AAC.1